MMRKRDTRARRLVVLCGLGTAASVLTGPTARASDRVYLPEETDEVTSVRVSAVHGWAELLLRAHDDRADDYRLREYIFSPNLHLGVDGSVYHEKFLVYSLNGTASFENRQVSGSETRSDNLTFADYDNLLTFFKNRGASVQLFARQNEAWVNSPFRGSYRTHATDFGGEVRTRPVVPLTLGYSHGERRENYDTGADRNQTQEEVRAAASHRLWFSQTDASVRVTDYTQDVQFQDYQTVGATFDNTLRARRDAVSRLRSSARYLNQYGTIRRRDFSLLEQALFQPARTLEGTLQYQFGEQTGAASLSSSSQQLIRSHRGDAGAQHVLYGSLTTGLRLYTIRETTYDNPEMSARVAEDTRNGGRLEIGYRRATPLGRLYLGAGFERAREDRNALEGTRSVSNEEHVMRDGNEPELANTGVDVSTIVVTDETGFVVYVEGVDYTILEVGTRVQLFRVVTGSIVNSQVVRVDYRYTFSPDIEFDTYGRTFNAQLDAKNNVSLYYRYSLNEEKLRSGAPDASLEDRTLHIAGVTYRIGGFSVGEEYEINRVSLSEFESNRVYGLLDFTALGRTRFSTGAHYTWTNYTDVDRTLNVVMVTARFVSQLPRHTTLEGDAWLRVDRGDPPGSGLNSDVTGVELKLEKQYRAVVLAAGAFFRDGNNNNQVDDTRSNVFVSLKRLF